MSASGGDEGRTGTSGPASGKDNLEGSSRALAGGGQDRLTLGAFLRVERERRGVTPEQLASATKINIRRIHALEADLYTELPAAPFVRGFIESYCRFIGLNSRDVLLRFDSFLSEQYSRRSDQGGISGYAFERREGEQNKSFIWLGLGAVLVVGLIGLAVLRPSSRHGAGENIEALISQGAATSPSPSPVESAVADSLPSASPSDAASASPVPSPSSSASPSASPLPSSSPSSSTLPAAEPSPVPSAAPSAPAGWVPGGTGPDLEDPLSSGVKLPRDQIRHKIIARSLADVWVRYQCDGRAPMKFVLRAGKVLVLRGAERIVLQASNTDALEISYNQSAYRTLSKARAPQPQSSGPAWVFAALGAPAEEVFPGQKPLAKTPGPLASPTPSVAPSPAASISR